MKKWCPHTLKALLLYVMAVGEAQLLKKSFCIQVEVYLVNLQLYGWSRRPISSSVHKDRDQEKNPNLVNLYMSKNKITNCVKNIVSTMTASDSHNSLF